MSEGGQKTLKEQLKQEAFYHQGHSLIRLKDVEKIVEGLATELRKPELSKKDFWDIVYQELRLHPPLSCMNSDFQLGFERGFQLGHKFRGEEILARLGVAEEKGETEQ